MIVNEAKTSAEDMIDGTEEKIKETKEEAKKMAEEVKEAVKEDKDVKIEFNPRRALKYLLTGFLGAAAGVAGKTMYDNRRSGRDAQIVILDPISTEESTIFNESASDDTDF